MATWNFNVTHKNQSTATGSADVTPPGIGKSITIANVPCSCGYNHTLVGTQTAATAMSGSGDHSVEPGNDPHAKPGIKQDPVPSWDGSPVTFPGDKHRHKKS